MPVEHPVLPVRPPEVLKVGHEPGQIIPARGDSGQGAEEAHTLQIYGGREHCPYFRIHSEQLSVEIRHCRIGVLLEQKKCALDGIEDSINSALRRHKFFFMMRRSAAC